MAETKEEAFKADRKDTKANRGYKRSEALTSQVLK